MRLFKLASVAFILASVAFSIWFYFVHLNLTSVAKSICTSIEVHLQLGSYRTARELATATLHSAFPQVSGHFNFDNLKDPAQPDSRSALLKWKCQIPGRSESEFEILMFPNQGMLELVINRFFALLIMVVAALFFIDRFTRLVARFIFNQVNSSLKARLGISSSGQPGWISSWLERVPAVSEAGRRLQFLLGKLDYEMNRSSELEINLARRRMFSKYLHDLRSPIGALRIVLEKRKALFSPDESEMVSQIMKRLEEIPQTVLESESTAMRDREKGVVRVDEFFSIVEHICSRLAIKFGAECSIDVSIKEDSSPPSTHQLKIGPVDIDRLLTNLAENARQAGAKTVKVILGYSTGHQLFIVEDDGPGGLGQSLQPVNRRPDGFGLGLEIVREILEKSNSKLKVQSPPGEGTRIEIQIPEKKLTVS